MKGSLRALLRRKLMAEVQSKADRAYEDSATIFSLRRPLYLDYAATTPLAPESAEAMQALIGEGGLSANFGNAGSRSHIYGWQCEALVEKARSACAALVGADVREIFFTSGATEANNLVIHGVFSRLIAEGLAPEACHFVTAATEHKAVLDPFLAIEAEGASVTRLLPDEDGVITREALRDALQDDTRLVSLMHVNNETGVVNDIAGFKELCAEHQVLFHSDCSQSPARTQLSFADTAPDFASFSGHKLYGPKGVGFLFVGRAARPYLSAHLQGGGQERGLRPGTLPVHQLAGLGAAAETLLACRDSDLANLQACQEAFLHALFEKVSGQLATINAERAMRVNGIVNLCFAAGDSETLLASLQGVAISSGSACNSTSVEPSHVLLAHGLSRQQAGSSLRFSFGRFTKPVEARAAGYFVDERLNLVDVPSSHFGK